MIEHHQEALELNLSTNTITWLEDSYHLLDNELRIKTLLLNHITGVATARMSESLRTNSYLERLELEYSGMRGFQCQELLGMLDARWRDAENGQVQYNQKQQHVSQFAFLTRACALTVRCVIFTTGWLLGMLPQFSPPLRFLNLDGTGLGYQVRQMDRLCVLCCCLAREHTFYMRGVGVVSSRVLLTWRFSFEIGDTRCSTFRSRSATSARSGRGR